MEEARNEDEFVPADDQTSILRAQSWGRSVSPQSKYKLLKQQDNNNNDNDGDDSKKIKILIITNGQPSNYHAS